MKTMTQTVAAEVTRVDRIFRTDSTSIRVNKRADALDVNEASRAAAYPLQFALRTGRFSAETAGALLAMKPAAFAAAAVKIAASPMPLRDAVEAWRSAV